MQLGTRFLTLSLGGFERTAEVSDCRIVSGPIESRQRHLCEPDREYRLQGTGVQDPATGTLWDLVWEYAETDVEVDLRPAGGVAPSEDQPWFTGTVTITEPDGVLLGGQADARNGGRFTFAFDWVFKEKPLRVVA
jgi:hypothetical protein